MEKQNLKILLSKDFYYFYMKYVWIVLYAGDVTDQWILSVENSLQYMLTVKNNTVKWETQRQVALWLISQVPQQSFFFSDKSAGKLI